MKLKYSAQGFTLLELTMVLFILSLLLAGFLVPLAARVEQKERSDTQIQLDEIETVVYGYVLQNNHLPCPDCSDNTGDCAALTANDGEEDLIRVGSVSSCATEKGNLPWVTLGVKETDAWNNRFTYRVDDSFADRDDPASDGTGCSASATLNVSFSLCSVGDIIVRGGAGGAKVATEIPAIIVSHGKNFSDNVPSADETENLDPDTNFVDKVYSSAAGTEFDDMLLWISPHVLKTMSVNGGILP